VYGCYYNIIFVWLVSNYWREKKVKSNILGYRFKHLWFKYIIAICKISFMNLWLVKLHSNFKLKKCQCLG